MERGIGAILAMSAAYFYIAVAVLLVALLTYTAARRGGRPLALDKARAIIDSLDIQAFRNLVNPSEEDFLRSSLPLINFEESGASELGPPLPIPEPCRKLPWSSAVSATLCAIVLIPAWSNWGARSSAARFCCVYAHWRPAAGCLLPLSSPIYSSVIRTRCLSNTRVRLVCCFAIGHLSMRKNRLDRSF